MHSGAGTYTGALSSADAGTDASISTCAYVGTNSSAHTSSDPRAYTSTDVSPYACTNAGAP